MTKLVTVVGARPQFIKASVVTDALLRRSGIQEVVIHTGQHFDTNMSRVFFEELQIPSPAYELDIHGGRHGEMTGRMLAGIEEILVDEAPAAVLVYGDTNSTLAGALAAVKLHIPVAHVEAGLRSFNLAMPEEVNRIVTDRISRWLFTPTTLAETNLRREGVESERIVPVGDVMYDVALRFGSRVDPGEGALARLGLPVGSYVLATLHRAENTDDPVRLAAVGDALRAVSAELPVVWPLHPRTRWALAADGGFEPPPGLHLVPPVGYLDMVRLERHAAVIATDSGGVQKEAFFHRVPCVTLRSETEWQELVDRGWNRLAPPTSAAAVAEAILGAIGTLGEAIAPYGDGDAAERIANALAGGLS